MYQYLQNKCESLYMKYNLLVWIKTVWLTNLF